MRQVFAATALAGALSLAAGGALPQPMTGPGGFMHGQHPGMMGQGLGFADPAGYLNGLKVALGITAVQEPALERVRRHREGRGRADAGHASDHVRCDGYGDLAGTP